MKEKSLMEAKKRNRIEHLRNYFVAGGIASWQQVFALYAKSTLAVDMGLHFHSFENKVKHSGKFKIEEVLTLARLLNVDYRIILKFLINLIPGSLRRAKDKELIS